MTYVDGNYVSFMCNLHQSPRLLKLCGGGKTNSFLLVGVLSHSLFVIDNEDLQIHEYCHVQYDTYCDGLGCWSFLQWYE